MFLAALNRLPKESEAKRFVGYIERNPRSGYEEAYWAILNTSEFMTCH